MKHPKMAAPLLAGALLLGGVAACSEENPTGEVEDVSPELDGGEGEEGIGDEEDE